MAYLNVYIPQRTYFGEDIIDGVITLVVNNPTQNRGISVSLTGVESTKVKVKGNPHSKEDHTFMCKRKRYYTQPTQKEGTEEIPSNVYYIPFAFKLPPYLPPSFKAGDFAAIAYKIMVCADISPHSCKPVSTDLLVGGNLFSDTEFTANNSVPVIQMQQMKILWRGTVHGEVTVPKSNYYFGETCAIEVNTDNNSKHLIRGHRVYMRCQIAYTANSHADNALWKYTETTEPFSTPVPQMTHNVHTLNYILPPTIIPTIVPMPNCNKNITCQCEIVVVFDIKNSPDFEVIVPVNIMARKPLGTTRSTGPVTCCHCNTTIETFRYKCKSCKIPYDLCYACRRITPCVHASHEYDFEETPCLPNELVTEVSFVNMGKDRTSKVMKVLYPVGKFMVNVVQELGNVPSLN